VDCKVLLKNYHFIWLLYSSILVLLYFPARHMCVFDDMANFYALVEKIGWAGFGNSYGFTSNYFTHNLLMVSLYKLFGNQQIYYYLLGCVWHAGNATLLLKLLNRWIILIDKYVLQHLPICASLLWLISCMQTENILSAGTLQYQYICTILLSILLFFHSWMIGISSSKIHYLLLLLFFISGLFAQEISVFFPIVIFIAMCFYAALKSNHRKWLPFIVQWFLPMSGAVIFYFCLHYYTFHNWLPHYGDAHLQGITLPNITEYFSINFFKNILLAHYGSATYSQALHSASKQEGWMLVLWISILISSIAICFARNKKTGIFMIFLLFLFAILYAPSANFGSYTFENIINDRLLFFPRLFLFAILFLLLVSIHKKLIIIFICFTSLQIILLLSTINQYKIAGNTMQIMQSTFQYKPDEKIFFLNLPYQYKGATICRYPYSIASNMMVYNHIDLQDNYISIARKTKWKNEEDITITAINDSTIQLQNNIANEWFAYDGVVEKPVFQNQYTFRNLPYNAYQLSIYSSCKNYRLLYLAHDGFHDFVLGTDSFIHIKYP
jgi:hypothetical protein